MYVKVFHCKYVSDDIEVFSRQKYILKMWSIEAEKYKEIYSFAD